MSDSQLDKIAMEAWHKIAGILRIPQISDETAVAIIKSACERATKDANDAYLLVSEKNRELHRQLGLSRAAHASEQDDTPRLIHRNGEL